MAQANPVTGTFTGTGTSDSYIPNTGQKQVERAFFNVTLSGTWAGTMQLQRSFDLGTTWVKVKDYTANASEIGEECGANIHYRWECTVYTSGTITYRISR